MVARKQSESRVCAICGINPATTKDHLPPKCIYPDLSIHGMNFFTVNACKNCNNGSSNDDEIFKLIIGFSTAEKRKDVSLVGDSLDKTLLANRKISYSILKNSYLLNYPFMNGKSEPTMAIVFDGPAYERVVERIIRGLYWREKLTSLGIKAKIHVITHQNFHSDVIESIESSLAGEEKNLNGGTFCYKVKFFDDGESLWKLVFFNAHTVYGYSRASQIDTRQY